VKLALKPAWRRQGSRTTKLGTDEQESLLQCLFHHLTLLVVILGTH
jgi:hypothetical protein